MTDPDVDEFNPMRCSYHKRDIEKLGRKITSLRETIFGNNKEGIVPRIKALETYMKILLVMSLSILGSVITLLFKVFGG